MTKAGMVGRDIGAGAIVAILLIPQGMAYALLAGLPPELGLYAAVVTPLAYAIAGGSGVVAVGPVAITSIVVAAALVDHPVDQLQSGAIVLAAESGLVLMLIRSLRLGVLINFVSLPVFSGFSNGAAVAIICSQLPALFDLSSPRTTGEPLELVTWTAANIGRAHPSGIAAGMAALVLLWLGRAPLRLLLRRLSVTSGGVAAASRAFPLLVIFASIWVAQFVEVRSGYSLRIVGALPDALPSFPSCPKPLRLWIDLLPSAVLLALINYVSNVTIARRLAGSNGRCKDRELSALGVANIASATFGLMPVAGSFSRSAVAFEAGAQSRLTGVTSALLVAVFCLHLSSWISELPRVVLAALIVLAAVQTIDVHIPRQIFATDRSDAVVLLATLLAVIVAGAEVGLFIGIFLGVGLHLKRTSQPHLVVLGRVAGTETFRRLNRPDVHPTPGILVIRIDENLYFANVGAVEEFIGTCLQERPDTRYVLLALSAVNLIDSSAANQLDALDHALLRMGIEMHLTEIKGPVLDTLRRTNLGKRLGGSRIHRSAHAAVALLREEARS